MDKDKVLKFPISNWERIKNQMGKGYVPCMVSERWIQFPNKSGGNYSKGEFIEISVMTRGDNGKPRKLCDLVITREDIVRAIDSVEKPDV